MRALPISYADDCQCGSGKRVIRILTLVAGIFIVALVMARITKVPILTVVGTSMRIFLYLGNAGAGTILLTRGNPSTEERGNGTIPKAKECRIDRGKDRALHNSFAEKPIPSKEPLPHSGWDGKLPTAGCRKLTPHRLSLSLIFWRDQASIEPPLTGIPGHPKSISLGISWDLFGGGFTF